MSSDGVLPSALTGDNENDSGLLSKLYRGREHIKISFGVVDSIFMILFIWAGMFSRFFILQAPRYPVQTEAYYGTKVNQINQNYYYFSSEPPLPELILLWDAYFTDYDSNLVFEDGKKFSNTYYVTLRSAGSILSGFRPILSYVCARIMGFKPTVAALAGIFMVSDLASITTERLIGGNGVGNFFASLAFTLILLNRKLNTTITIVATAFVLGLAVSSSYNAASIFFVSIALDIYDALRVSSLRRKTMMQQTFLRSLFNLIVIFCVYSGLTAVRLGHLIYKQSGECDGPASVCATLIPRGERRSAFANITMTRRVFDTIKLQIASRRSNVPQISINESSSLFSWPFLTCKWPLLFKNDQLTIFGAGNPFLHWMTAIAIIVFPLEYIFGSNVDVSVIIGYFVSLVFISIKPGPKFVTDYALPMLFAILILTNVVAILPKRIIWGTVIFTGFFSLFGYFYYAPIVYGLEYPDMGFMRLIPRWY